MGKHGEEHQLDVETFERARSIHRVVRAMHDGECPECHGLFRSDQMRPSPSTLDMVCPGCQFTISEADQKAAIAEFGPVMERNLGIFLEWRAVRGAREAQVYMHVYHAPDRCRADGGAHLWNGPTVDLIDGQSVTCSKCGVDAMSVDMATAP